MDYNYNKKFLIKKFENQNKNLYNIVYRLLFLQIKKLNQSQVMKYLKKIYINLYFQQKKINIYNNKQINKRPNDNLNIFH